MSAFAKDDSYDIDAMIKMNNFGESSLYQYIFDAQEDF